MAHYRKNIILGIVLAAIAGSIIYLESGKKTAPSISLQSDVIPNIPAASSTPNRDLAAKEKKFDWAKELINPDGFINTDKLKIADLIGKKVILVDFWTYTCINCQRTTPYLNAWYQKYKDQGLEIIGVHTPEFEFEKKYDNVKQAVKDERIEYPVVLDNDYATWNAYANRYWPHKYLIDIDGFIVYDHIGEGAYGETEQKIQESLEERMRVLQMQGQLEKDATQPKNVTVVDSSKVGSPETYFGASRNQFLGNGQSEKAGVQLFTEPSKIELNKLYLSGNWNIADQFAKNARAGDTITFRYQAKNVYFVASSADNVRIKILRDGKPLGQEAGSDISKDGSSSVLIKDARLYKLIEDPAGYGEHVLKIIIEKPGMRAFTFTFG